ncbi:hypothetical protein H1R20_g7900, partial [Candolleomyces eurysporus]
MDPASFAALIVELAYAQRAVDSPSQYLLVASIVIVVREGPPLLPVPIKDPCYSGSRYPRYSLFGGLIGVVEQMEPGKGPIPAVPIFDNCRNGFYGALSHVAKPIASCMPMDLGRCRCFSDIRHNNIRSYLVSSGLRAVRSKS